MRVPRIKENRKRSEASKQEEQKLDDARLKFNSVEIWLVNYYNTTVTMITKNSKYVNEVGFTFRQIVIFPTVDTCLIS